jgi:enamine deaminase RidA (YjgF/YER057c/UK114 family)
MALHVPEPEIVLKGLGLELPEPFAPVATYRGAVIDGGLVYVSGQGPMRNGQPVYVGKVGAEVSNADGYKAAQLCALNCLAHVKAAVGALARVVRVVKVVGFVNSAPDFTQHPWIVNGASDLLVEVLGEERGAHARSAVGVAALPLNVTVALEMIVRVS